MGPLLFIALVALVGAIIALYVVSRRCGLHQQALVHEFDFSLADVAVGLAPYSIIPTLFAVGIKLWYGAIEENMRRLQAFLAMAVRPAPIWRSLLVEYANAPLAFMSSKAVKNSHYMLALVGLGALGTEICQSTSTSSAFAPQSGSESNTEFSFRGGKTRTSRFIGENITNTPSSHRGHLCTLGQRILCNCA